MLASQYRSVAAKTNSPFVFFYQLGDMLEIALDEKTYGNDSRFCRRSTNFNAELRHIVDKGSLHLFIVTVKGVDKNQEILLPPDNQIELQQFSPLPSINSDVREIKKPSNGLLNTSTDDEPLAARGEVKERKKKERKKSKRSSLTSQPEECTSARKTRAQIHSQAPTASKLLSPKLESPKPEIDIKTEIKEEEMEVEINDEKAGLPAVSPSKAGLPMKVEHVKEEQEESFSDSEKPLLVNGRGNMQADTCRNMEADTPGNMQAEVQENTQAEMHAVTSPVKSHKTSPSSSSLAKLGLPDNKGLIVGVNTINYDASSSVRNKAKVTRIIF
jgi:hypothetical protein